MSTRSHVVLVVPAVLGTVACLVVVVVIVAVVMGVGLAGGSGPTLVGIDGSVSSFLGISCFG